MSNLGKKKKTRALLNGYSLHVRDSMARRVPEPGETAEECRKRTLQESLVSWKESTAAYKKGCSEHAKGINRCSRNCESICSLQNQQNVEKQAQVEQEALAAYSDQCASQCIASYRPAAGLGAMGLRDTRFGLAEATVQAVDSAHKGFVKTWSAKWRTEANSICPENLEMKQATAGRVRLSCLQECLVCTKTHTLKCFLIFNCHFYSLNYFKF